MSLQQVLDYSNGITIKTGEWDLLFSLSLLMALLAFTSLATTMILVNARYPYGVEGTQIILNILFVILIALMVPIFPILVWNYPETGQEKEYETAQKEWTTEYVVPYLQKQLVESENIHSVEYNYDLEDEKSLENYLVKEYNVPVKVQLQNGKTIEGWAKVEPENGKEKIVYAKVEKEIPLGEKPEENLIEKFFTGNSPEYIAPSIEWFKIKKGYYLITLYTDREI